MGFGLNVPSSIEIKLMDELNKRGLSFEYQKRVFGEFYVDIAFPEKKIAVECDGDYWHANPKKYAGKQLNEIQTKNISKDKKREKVIAAFGWKIIRFWENEIENDVKSCADRIVRELERN